MAGRRTRHKHKSRASGPGFCGVYLSGFVSSARRRLFSRCMSEHKPPVVGPEAVSVGVEEPMLRQFFNETFRVCF